MKQLLAIALILVTGVCYAQDRSGIYEVRGEEVSQDASVPSTLASSS